MKIIQCPTAYAYGYATHGHIQDLIEDTKDVVEPHRILQILFKKGSFKAKSAEFLMKNGLLD
jgi:hypothetical protein